MGSRRVHRSLVRGSEPEPQLSCLKPQVPRSPWLRSCCPSSQGAKNPHAARSTDSAACGEDSRHGHAGLSVLREGHAGRRRALGAGPFHRRWGWGARPLRVGAAGLPSSGGVPRRGCRRKRDRQPKVSRENGDMGHAGPGPSAAEQRCAWRGPAAGGTLRWPWRGAEGSCSGRAGVRRSRAEGAWGAVGGGRAAGPRRKAARGAGASRGGSCSRACFGMEGDRASEGRGAGHGGRCTPGPAVGAALPPAPGWCTWPGRVPEAPVASWATVNPV